MKRKTIACFVVSMVLMAGSSSVFADMELKPAINVENSITVRSMTEAEKEAFDANEANGTAAKISLTVNDMTQLEKEGLLKNMTENLRPVTSIWSQSVPVPVANYSSTNGVVLGFDFITSPKDLLVIEVGELPEEVKDINISVEYSNGMYGTWTGGIRGFQKLVIDLGKYSNYSVKVKASTFAPSPGAVFFNAYTCNAAKR